MLSGIARSGASSGALAFGVAGSTKGPVDFPGGGLARESEASDMMEISQMLETNDRAPQESTLAVK